MSARLFYEYLFIEAMISQLSVFIMYELLSVFSVLFGRFDSMLYSSTPPFLKKTLGLISTYKFRAYGS